MPSFRIISSGLLSKKKIKYIFPTIARAWRASGELICAAVASEIIIRSRMEILGAVNASAVKKKKKKKERREKQVHPLLASLVSGNAQSYARYSNRAGRPAAQSLDRRRERRSSTYRMLCETFGASGPKRPVPLEFFNLQLAHSRGYLRRRSTPIRRSSNQFERPRRLPRVLPLPANL